MAEFHEVLFPPHISYGSSGGPRFKTTIYTADSGYEQRNIDWSQTRGEWDVAHSMRDLVGTEQLVSIEELAAFFMARNGRMHGFRFRDPADCLLTDEPIGVGDGTTTVFQITKTYRSGQAESGSDHAFVRRVRKIEWDTLAKVSVGGVLLSPLDWSVDHDTGLVTLATPPAGPVFDEDGEEVTPGESVVIGEGVFHLPARFDTDHCEVTADFWNTASWPSIPIVEIRT